MEKRWNENDFCTLIFDFFWTQWKCDISILMFVWMTIMSGFYISRDYMNVSAFPLLLLFILGYKTIYSTSIKQHQLCRCYSENCRRHSEKECGCFHFVGIWYSLFSIYLHFTHLPFILSIIYSEVAWSRQIGTLCCRMCKSGLRALKILFREIMVNACVHCLCRNMEITNSCGNKIKRKYSHRMCAERKATVHAGRQSKICWHTQVRNQNIQPKESRSHTFCLAMCMNMLSAVWWNGIDGK